MLYRGGPPFCSGSTRGWQGKGTSRAHPVTSGCVALQLPEPLISFRFYHELVGLAKDSLKAEAEAKAASRGRQDGSESEVATLTMAGRLRELMRDLPAENRATLLYLLRHLRR